MAVSRRDLALQMLAQLRLLDPSASAEPGTPERKILDTVASALYDNQIDLDALSTALDVDSKYGAGLERFLNIFGFARQQATYATGFVTFSRIAPSTVDIRIPANSIVLANVVNGDFTDVPTINVPFYTLYSVVLPAGETSIVVPIRANVGGSRGNVAANTITQISGNAIFGITAVTNEVATSGGKDSESDEELKVRFTNTVFRNLAGTQDQYMALATATAFTSKVNVVGPQSYYREYIQVPAVDDATAFDVGGTAGAEAGGGNAGEWTTALSTLPYAKRVYATEIPAFVSNGEAGLGSIFYRQDVDFVLNYLGTTNTSRRRGDTLRFITAGLKDTDLTNYQQLHQPNVTFKNVYSGTNEDVQAIRPREVVLLEFAYVSAASRNDPSLGVTNAVDVFIDGGDNTFASTVTPKPNTTNAFVDDPTSKFHYENYRRIGEPEKRPFLGNVFQSLYWQPVIDVPETIVVGKITYYRGQHYWPVQDVSTTGQTVRARNGIEWSTKEKGRRIADDEFTPNSPITDPPGNPSLYTGPIITELASTTAIEINDYIYDKNINILQSSLEGSKQITTDVLAHKSKIRYFKLDITVMYSPGAPIADTNSRVRDAVDRYLKAQTFGSTIQLSDILQVIHDQTGIDNVRWTSDTIGATSTTRIYETDRNGRPLLDISSDYYQYGIATLRPDIQTLFVTGKPTSGRFGFISPTNVVTSFGNMVNLATAYTAANVQTALTSIGGWGGSLTVTEDIRSTYGVRLPIRSFRITKTTANGNGVASNGVLGTIRPTFALTGDVGTAVTSIGGYLIKDDFFLHDDELAALPELAFTPTSGTPDSVPGMIIRPRAQNTWIQPN